MAASTAEALAAIEARLRAILAPYEDRLETASIYTIPTLRRPGAKAHDWFAFVKPAAKHVSFFLLPVYTFPALREGLSPALAKRLTAKSAFTLASLDEELATELEGLVARAYEAYTAAAGGGSGGPGRRPGVPALRTACQRPPCPNTGRSGRGLIRALTTMRRRRLAVSPGLPPPRGAPGRRPESAATAAPARIGTGRRRAARSRPRSRR